MAGISVFLVEDNEQIREHLIPALADLGSASVLAVAQTEDEAVNWLARHKGQWDLAVVDLFLAQDRGLALSVGAEGATAIRGSLCSPTIQQTRCGKRASMQAPMLSSTTQLEEFFDFCLQQR